MKNHISRNNFKPFFVLKSLHKQLRILEVYTSNQRRLSCTIFDKQYNFFSNEISKFYSPRFHSRPELSRHLNKDDDPLLDLERILQNFCPKENLRKRKRRNSENSESPTKRRSTCLPSVNLNEIDTVPRHPLIDNCSREARVYLTKFPDAVRTF